MPDQKISTDKSPLTHFSVMPKRNFHVPRPTIRAIQAFLFRPDVHTREK